MTPEQKAILEQWAKVANATAALVECVPTTGTLMAALNNPLALHQQVTRFRNALANADSAVFAVFHILDSMARPVRPVGRTVDFEALGITEEEFNLVLEHRKESK